MSDSTVTTAHPAGLKFAEAESESTPTPILVGGLSPWPTDPTQLAAAITRLKAIVAGRAKESDEDAAHLGTLAAALVEREAADAPQAIKDEAVIRMAGYIAQSDFGSIRSETGSPGSYSLEYAMNHGMAFRRCGAKALLAPWRTFNAGVIG